MEKKVSIFKFVFVLFVLVFTPLCNRSVSAQNEVHLIIKGELKEQSGAFIENGKTLLPLRLIGESLGYEVSYEKTTREVRIQKQDKKISMWIGKKSYQMNGDTKAMDVAPMIKNSTAYVPVRLIAELFGEKIGWDSENRVIIVSEYGEADKAPANPVEFQIGNIRFSLDKSFQSSIGTYKKAESIFFYDIYNKEKSKDRSSGALCAVTLSKYPDVISIPGIILDYDGEYYLEAIFESGVEYSSENGEFKKRYEESMNLLKKVFRTLKIKK